VSTVVRDREKEDVCLRERWTKRTLSVGGEARRGAGGGGRGVIGVAREREQGT